MASRFALLLPELSRLRVIRTQFPIFGELQYRSGVGINQMLLKGVFKDPEPVMVSFAGLLRRVNQGLEGSGTPAWQRMLRLGKVMPHETMIFGGPLVHIPEDIRGGLEDALADVERLPDPEDYLQMYAAVRASMKSVSQDLLLEVGTNTTSYSINANEAIIRLFGRDPVQAIRDREYALLKGTPKCGLPEGEIISMVLDAIRADPFTHEPIVRRD
jgi:hypothetical protein